jgi:hypothetical protein
LRMYIDGKWERSQPDVSTSPAFRISRKNEAHPCPYSPACSLLYALAGLLGTARGQRPSASSRCVTRHICDRCPDRSESKSKQSNTRGGRGRELQTGVAELTQWFLLDGFVLFSAWFCQPRCLQTRPKKRTRC